MKKRLRLDRQNQKLEWQKLGNGHYQCHLTLGVANLPLIYADDYGNETVETIEADELFNDDSIITAYGLPICLDHPANGLYNQNAENSLIGHTLETFTRQDNTLLVTATITDKRGIDLIDSMLEKNVYAEISPGYWLEDVIDGKQIFRRYDHVALLPAGEGRGGQNIVLRTDTKNFKSLDFKYQKNDSMPPVKNPGINNSSEELNDVDVIPDGDESTDDESKTMDSIGDSNNPYCDESPYELMTDEDDLMTDEDDLMLDAQDGELSPYLGYNGNNTTPGASSENISSGDEVSSNYRELTEIDTYTTDDGTYTTTHNETCMTKITFQGKSIEVPDATANFLSNASIQMDSIKKQRDNFQGQLEALKIQLDSKKELITLDQAVSFVKESIELWQKVEPILKSDSKDFVPDYSLKPTEIKELYIRKFHPSINLDGKSEDFINGIWTGVADNINAKINNDAIDKVRNQLNQLTTSEIENSFHSDGDAKVEKSRQDRMSRIINNNKK